MTLFGYIIFFLISTPKSSGSIFNRMALADGGRQSSPEKTYTELRNVCPRIDSVSNLADSTDIVINGHDIVHCAYSPQNTEMVDVLMNNRVNENQPEFEIKSNPHTWMIHHQLVQ